MHRNESNESNDRGDRGDRGDKTIAAGSTSVFRGRARAYVVESKNKLLIDSIYNLYVTFFQQHSAAEDAGAEFKMLVVAPKRRADNTYALHLEGALTPDRTRRAQVQCTTLGNYINNQTGTMPNDRLLRMLDMLQNQAQTLEGLNWSVPYYGLDDVLIINDTFFCFINDDKLFAFDPDTRLMDVTRPISRANAFYAPELEDRLHALPYELDYRASFYSLGLLATFCALLNWDLVSTVASHETAANWRTYSESDLVAMLDPIKYSKLYWFVLRCCRTDASRRLRVFV
jgi:hypothetical protein